MSSQEEQPDPAILLEQISGLMDMVEGLRERIDDKDVIIEELRVEIREKDSDIETLRQRIDELGNEIYLRDIQLEEDIEALRCENEELDIKNGELEEIVVRLQKRKKT